MRKRSGAGTAHPCLPQTLPSLLFLSFPLHSFHSVYPFLRSCPFPIFPSFPTAPSFPSFPSFPPVHSFPSFPAFPPVRVHPRSSSVRARWRISLRPRGGSLWPLHRCTPIWGLCKMRLFSRFLFDISSENPIRGTRAASFPHLDILLSR